MMVKNNRKVASSAMSHSQSSSNFPARNRNAAEYSRSPARKDGRVLSQMPKGQYESPLKRFARQNEGNVLSSGDSGSNLGSLNDR